MDFIKQASKVFTNDNKSLKEVVKKEHWLKPFLTIIIISFLVTILDMGILEALSLVIATIILALISAGSLHLALILFKGKATFKQTLTVNFNVQLLPSIVFGVLALISFILSKIINLLGEIVTTITIFLLFIYIPWFMIIMTQSLSQVHKLSLGKSYIAQIISLLVTGLIGLVFVFLFILLFLLPEPMLIQDVMNLLLVQ